MPPDDAELLQRYAMDGSEAAFAALVERYLNQVYFAAMRQMDGDAHRAEDVAQQVFTRLARKAGALAGRPTLAGWLFVTTRHVASEVRRAERRRQAHEQEALAMNELLRDPAASADWERLRPVIDDAMHKLNDTDREAVLLRFFHARPFAEIGSTLRISEDAARMRVDRALDKLRALLARRGIDSTAAALATVLANQAAATAPAGLAASITGAALSGAAVAEAGIAVALIAFMTATKTTVTLGVAAAVALTTGIYQTSQARTAAAKLAAESRAFAAERDRAAELEGKVRTAEQALTGREKAKAQQTAAAASSAPTAPVNAAAAAAQQKALQQYLDSNPELRALKAEAKQADRRRNIWPVFLGVGLTLEQAERAHTMTEEIWLRRKARMDAGEKDARPDYSPLRAAFGDALVERWAEFNKDRWMSGEVVRQLAADFYFADVPFTAKQKTGLIQILDDAKMTEKWKAEAWVAPVTTYYHWDKILAQAESILSPAQMRGLQAKAASSRMEQIEAAAKKEATAAAKP